jgi:MraZ protein
MIIGQYISNVSKSRRVAVPKQFRKELGERFVIAKWYEKCLVLVSKNNWRELHSRLSGQTRVLTTPVRDTDRFILGSAYEAKSDAQGRIVLPKPLSDYARIGAEALFLGLGDRVEIWERKEWEKRELYIATHAAGMLESIAKDA